MILWIEENTPPPLPASLFDRTPHPSRFLGGIPIIAALIMLYISSIFYYLFF